MPVASTPLLSLAVYLLVCTSSALGKITFEVYLTRRDLAQERGTMGREKYISDFACGSWEILGHELIRCHYKVICTTSPSMIPGARLPLSRCRLKRLVTQDQYCCTYYSMIQIGRDGPASKNKHWQLVSVRMLRLDFLRRGISVHNMRGSGISQNPLCV